MSGCNAQPALSIERLTVRLDRVVCEVKLAAKTPRLTWPALIKRVCDTYPNLAFHSCVNDRGDTFGAVMACTAVPHLLEHLVIDMQAAACPLPCARRAVFVGTTEWTDEAQGRARIEVNFTDDLIALRAFCDAVSFLNKIMGNAEN